MWDKSTTDVRMNAKICLVNQDLHENIFLVENVSVRNIYFLVIFASYEMNAFTKMSLNTSKYFERIDQWSMLLDHGKTQNWGCYEVNYPLMVINENSVSNAKHMMINLFPSIELVNNNG